LQQPAEPAALNLIAADHRDQALQLYRLLVPSS
jgi:hypothetical protein